ncbi:MAG: hypothetical protein ACRDTT_00585 [Pseudonocardiaceae bacterium]
MTPLLDSELLKLRTTRVPLALLNAAVGGSVTMAALIVVLSSRPDISGEVGARLVLSSGGITGGVMALLLGIVATAGEYRHGTILPTLLVTPDRPRVTLTQIIASAVAGALIGATSVAAAMAVGIPLLAARDVAFALSAWQLVGLVLGGVCFTTLSGALGAALGALMRSQVGAVALAMMILFVIEPGITELKLIDGYQRYSLIGVRVAMSGGAAESAGEATGGLPPFWLAALIWTGCTLALIVAATVTGRRRDIP